MQRYWLSCTWVIKGIKLWCPHPTLKIMCLPLSLLGTKVRALNNALIATTKKKKIGFTAKSAVWQCCCESTKVESPLTDTKKKQSADFHVKEKRWKGIESKRPFKHLYCSPSWDLSELWKVSSGLQSAEETDPVGASIALRSGSINFILKMLLLERNVYSMTSRPHHESRLVAIISWLRTPKSQTPLTPGNAHGKSWHTGNRVTLWWMGKWWNTEVLWPPPQQIVPLPLRRTECITFTASGLGKMSAWCSKISASAAHCSITSYVCVTSADSFMFVIKQGRLNMILRLPARKWNCRNSRRFHRLSQLPVFGGKEENEMIVCWRTHVA